MNSIRLAAAVVALAVVAAAPARAEMKTQVVEYNHGEAKLKGYMAWDDSKTGKRPAIFLLHGKWGVNEGTQRQVEMWSKQGYVVFAADMFGALPMTDPDTRKLTDIYRNDRALLKARAQAGFDVFVKNPLVDTAKIAQVGYCFGGTVAVEFGSTGVPFVTSIAIHGSYGVEPGWAKTIKGMFVILHGAEDPNYPREIDKALADLREAKVPFELNLYSGTKHGFSEPKNKAEERANAEAIAAATRILKEQFGT